jgi:hypothetical protein
MFCELYDYAKSKSYDSLFASCGKTSQVKVLYLNCLKPVAFSFDHLAQTTYLYNFKKMKYDRCCSVLGSYLTW